MTLKFIDLLRIVPPLLFKRKRCDANLAIVEDPDGHLTVVHGGTVWTSKKVKPQAEEEKMWAKRWLRSLDPIITAVLSELGGCLIFQIEKQDFNSTWGCKAHCESWGTRTVVWAVTYSALWHRLLWMLWHSMIFSPQKSCFNQNDWFSLEKLSTFFLSRLIFCQFLFSSLLLFHEVLL